MTEEGIVTELREGFVVVSVRQTTACSECKSRASCDSCASTISVVAHNDCDARVGDRVLLTNSSKRVLGYAFLVFVLPFLPAAIVYFAVDALFHTQIASVFASLAALVLFFLLLRLTVDRRAQRRCDNHAVRVLSGQSAQGNGI